MQAVSNWVVRQQLPSRYYVAMMHELKARGHSAPLHLWGMYPPRGKRGKRK